MIRELDGKVDAFGMGGIDLTWWPETGAISSVRLKIATSAKRLRLLMAVV